MIYISIYLCIYISVCVSFFASPHVSPTYTVYPTYFTTLLADETWITVASPTPRRSTSPARWQNLSDEAHGLKGCPQQNSATELYSGRGAMAIEKTELEKS